MHLLAAQPGGVSDGSEAVDLGQTPGDIVVISAADTELTLLAQARSERPADGFPSVRLANMMHLAHNMSVDLYVEDIIAHAKLVVLRVLGGRGYWPYGCDEIAALCAKGGIPVAFLPGDDQPDAELAALSTLDANAQNRLWQYLVHGGLENALDFLCYAAGLIGFETDWQEPRPLVRAGLYFPGAANTDLARVRSKWIEGRPVAALVFYRALVQAGNLWAVEAVIEGLAEAGLNPLPIFVASLKDQVAAATLETLMTEEPPAVILNATGFAVSAPGQDRTAGPFDIEGAPPVLQIVFSGGGEEVWRDGTRGLSARDIAMNVALPEVDGRVLTRAVSFKGSVRRDPVTETVEHRSGQEGWPKPGHDLDRVIERSGVWEGLGRQRGRHGEDEQDRHAPAAPPDPDGRRRASKDITDQLIADRPQRPVDLRHGIGFEHAGQRTLRFKLTDGQDRIRPAFKRSEVRCERKPCHYWPKHQPTQQDRDDEAGKDAQAPRQPVARHVTRVEQRSRQHVA